MLFSRAVELDSCSLHKITPEGEVKRQRDRWEKTVDEHTNLHYLHKI